MDSLRGNEALEAMKAVKALRKELEDALRPLARHARQLKNELDLLRQERDQNSRQIAPSRAIPDNVIGTVVDGLDTCIQQKSEVLHSVQMQMQPLVAERRFLHERHRNLTSQISPAHILPEELLVEIFMWARTDQLYIDYHDIPFPYVASWVSSRWRTVAIGNPILWRDVHISNDHSVNLVKTQIERSKTCALAVMLSTSYSSCFPRSADNDYWEDRLQGIMDIMLACSHRWCSFQLCESSEYDHSPPGLKNIGVIFNSLRNLSAPHLKYLRVRWPGLMYGEPLFTGGAPTLSHIELHNVDVRSNLPLLRGITHLTLADIPNLGLLTEMEFRNMLEACPLLTYLALEQECFILDSRTGHPSVINIPSLRSLTVSFYGGDSEDKWISGLFKRLSMAGLQSLRLAFLWRSHKSFISVMRVIPPSSRYPALSKLSICPAEDFSARVGERALELLLLFPHIEYLRLDFSDEEIWYILEALANHTEASGQPLCPQLRTLECYILLWAGEPEQRLESYIAKRASRGFPITKLRLHKALVEFRDSHGLLERLRDCVSVDHCDQRESWTDFPLMI